MCVQPGPQRVTPYQYSRDTLLAFKPALNKHSLTEAECSNINQLGINKHRGCRGQISSYNRWVHYKNSTSKGVHSDNIQSIPTRITNRSQNSNLKEKKCYQRGACISKLKEVTITKGQRKNIITLPTVYLTNCRSLNDRKLDLLQETAEQYKLDVICLTETWMTKTKEKQSELRDYNSHFCNRKDRIGGGVCIYTRNTIQAKTIASHTTSTLSAVWVLLSYENAPPLIVACIYHPPKADKATTLEYLENTANELTQKYPNARFVITGDFNRLPLKQLCEQFNLTERVNFSTRGDAVLDQIITDIREYKDAQELPPITQEKVDHCAILLTGVQQEVPKYTTVQKRKLNSETRQNIALDIAKENWSSVLQAETTDEKVNQLHETVNQILDKNCPLKSVKVRKDTPPWITDAIRKTLKARDKAYKKGCPSYKFLRSLATKMIRTQKQRYVRYQLNECTESKTWWKNIKKLETQSGDSNRSKYFIDSKWMECDQLAHNLNEYFISVGGSETHPSPTIPNTSAGPRALSIGEVKMMLGKLDPTKATSSDDFPTWISQELKEDMCIPVHDIVNSILKTGHYPQFWKIAQIRPLNKVPSPKQLKDFRPISLLFHLGKLVEDVILKELKQQISHNICDNQFAYQQKLSTTDALIILLDDWTEALDDITTSHIQAVCLDFSKAFDRMSHNRVLDKLQHLGAQPPTLNLIKSFLEDRQQTVKFNGSKSSTLNIKVGAPQGTKLGPWLWLTYVNDLHPTSVSEDTNEVRAVIYADDTTLYHPHLKGTHNSALQGALDHAAQWSSDNNMTLNADKTTLMNISLTGKVQQTTPLALMNTTLNEEYCAKFLGVHIDNQLSFNAHIEQLCSRANSLIHFLRKLKSLGMDLNGLKTFYIMKIRSLVSTSCAAWFPFLTIKCCDKLEAIQRSSTKAILPDLDYEDRCQSLSITTLECFLEDQTNKYFENRLKNPEHVLHKMMVHKYSNDCRKTRHSTIFRPPTCRTAKRKNSPVASYLWQNV